jgi:hypothetical protein
VHRFPRDVLLKRDRHNTSTKFRFGVIRWVHEHCATTIYQANSPGFGCQCLLRAVKVQGYWHLRCNTASSDIIEVHTQSSTQPADNFKCNITSSLYWTLSISGYMWHKWHFGNWYYTRFILRLVTKFGIERGTFRQPLNHLDQLPSCYLYQIYLRQWTLSNIVLA